MGLFPCDKCGADHVQLRKRDAEKLSMYELALKDIASVRRHSMEFESMVPLVIGIAREALRGEYTGDDEEEP